jgi:hypothetical protein
VKKTAICIGIASVLLLAFILSRPSPARLDAATLPDGTQIIIQAVTYGTNHHFVHGSKILSRVKTYLPGFISRWLPGQFAALSKTSQETLILWYSAYQPATKKYASVSVDELHVIDEHGCLFKANPSHGSQSTPTFSVSMTHIDTFPRRQKTFTLRAKFTKHPAVDLQIPNPLYPITTQWTSEPLPAVRQTNDLTVQLAGLRSSTRQSANYRYAYVSPELNIRENGVMRNDWYTHSHNYHDATGNSSRDALCPHERAWKVEVDFYKTDKAPFPDSAIWRVPNLEMPKSGEMMKLTRETQFGGFTLRPIAICGAGDFTFSNEVCVASSAWKEGAHESFSTRGSGNDAELKFASKNPSVLVHADGWRTFPELLVRAKTSEGQIRSLRFTGSGNNFCRFELDSATLGFQPFDLEFIPQQPMRFEFIVEPPLPAKTR